MIVLRETAISAPESELYDWNLDSTYIQEPPFLAEMTRDVQDLAPIVGARALLKLNA